jgi:hypothetical protein
VVVEFQVPPQMVVHHPPRLRVTDTQGNVIALTPMFVENWGPVARAYRDLPTGIYPAGSYVLTAEFDHRDGKGQVGRAVSTPQAVTGRGRPQLP